MEEKHEITREARERVRECVTGIPFDAKSQVSYASIHPVSLEASEHELTLRFIPNTDIYEDILMFARTVCDVDGVVGPDEMVPRKVFRNGPVTGVIWADGKKTLTRRDENDSDDTYLALLNNYLRKETNNRGKYELGWGDAEMEALSCADRCSPSGMRRVAKLLTFLADVTEMMEAE